MGHRAGVSIHPPGCAVGQVRLNCHPRADKGELLLLPTMEIDAQTYSVRTAGKYACALSNLQHGHQVCNKSA